MPAHSEGPLKTVFLAGGIGSGKSTVARELERLGAARIDLDELSREVLEPGSPVLVEIARAFGADLIDTKTGVLDRGLLARRAFATPEDAARLEALELPAIRALLVERLERLRGQGEAHPLCVVEVPLLDRMGAMRDLADEVLLVDCPLALRRVRAVKRGMTEADFDARAANQPTDEWLRAHAGVIIANEGTAEELLDKVRAWYEQGCVVHG